MISKMSLRATGSSSLTFPGTLALTTACNMVFRSYTSDQLVSSLKANPNESASYFIIKRLRPHERREETRNQSHFWFDKELDVVHIRAAISKQQRGRCDEQTGASAMQATLSGWYLIARNTPRFRTVYTNTHTAHQFSDDR